MLHCIGVQYDLIAPPGSIGFHYQVTGFESCGVGLENFTDHSGMHRVADLDGRDIHPVLIYGTANECAEACIIGYIKNLDQNLFLFERRELNGIQSKCRIRTVNGWCSICLVGEDPDFSLSKFSHFDSSEK